MTPTDKPSDVARDLYKLADKEGLHPKMLKEWIPALGRREFTFSVSVGLERLMVSGDESFLYIEKIGLRRNVVQITSGKALKWIEKAARRGKR